MNAYHLPSRTSQPHNPKLVKEYGCPTIAKVRVSQIFDNFNPIRFVRTQIEAWDYYSNREREKRPNTYIKIGVSDNKVICPLNVQ
jgi:hypothetical protein